MVHYYMRHPFGVGGLAVLVLLLAACTGDRGPTGPQGPGGTMEIGRAHV